MCKACDLWKNARQTVFGEGKPVAVYMLVGEQPGDSEEKSILLSGPLVDYLDSALAEAGINRKDVYVSNVVTHFKWSLGERGKRRIHKKPRDSEIVACRRWLNDELEIVKPKILVCLGASAAQSLLGKDFRVSRQRRQVVDSHLAPAVVATVHPSSILRARDEASREEQSKAFVQDLKFIAKLAKAVK